MSYKPSYKSGDWAALCDRCGRKYKATDLRLEWDGLYCCPSCWEPRNVQDFVRAKADVQAPPWTRPEAPDQFVTPQCDYLGKSAVPGYAVPGCMIPGYVADGVFFVP